MAKNYFNRYVWLIDVIQRHGYITFSDISDLWQISSLNEDGAPLPERTFFNHRDAIQDIFGIEFRFDKTLGYYLENRDLRVEGIRDWLLTSLSVNNLINESAEMRDRVLFEHIPSGHVFLQSIIVAMKEGAVLEMSYQKFSDAQARTFDVEPYCLKVYKQRWYMVGKPTEYSKPLVFALDRVRQLQQTRKSFKLPADFDAAAYFVNCFGIVHDESVPGQTVRLKVWDRQRQYFRTLPLHPSQQEVQVEADWSLFEYFLVPTWDLEQELLQYNDQVEVIEPQSLRNAMIEHAWNLLHLYGEA